ncbi:hypothetical protein [Luteolibacter luteus]|uniref:Uncharacterized protein n=1 Tax=Luteolibacter luteus TaxID=2728835 RepID=A0A858RL80_9BACT|nr:hypothetical protein [Luteolibacter luteus]QJE97218.1 hypothetical protein HHL09_15955 [Luteolibacter luteus]
MKALTPLRLLALPAVVLAVAPSCKNNSEARKDPEWWRLEGERVELAHNVDLLKLKLANSAVNGTEFAARAEEVKQNAARIAELKLIAGDIRDEVAQLASAVDEQHENWVRSTRAAAVGREYVTFTGRGGRSYDHVVIKKVTDVGVEIRHANGSARLSAADLTPEQNAEFGLDPQLAHVALAQEKQDAAVYEDWLGSQIALANEAKVAADEAAAARRTEEVLVAARARSEAIKASAAAYEERGGRLREQPRSVGGTYWGGYYGRRYYSPSYYYYGGSRCYSRGVVGGFATIYRARYGSDTDCGYNHPSRVSAARSAPVSRGTVSAIQTISKGSTGVP